MSASAIVKINLKNSEIKQSYDFANIILIKNYNRNKNYDFSNVIFDKKYRVHDLAHVYFNSSIKTKYSDFIELDSPAEAEVKSVSYTIVENKNWYDTAYIKRIQEATISNDKWYGYTSVLSTFVKDFGIVAYTKEFNRFNSNIYKNIFEHILFDLYSLQEKLIPRPYKQYNNVFQPNHGFNIHDLLYMNQYGIYSKGLANNNEYNVVGIVTEITNNNEFVLMTYGEIDINENISSDSGILYLSDTNYGKYETYENINNNFYTPIGFVNNNKIVINIMDSSVGDNLKLYQDQIFVQNLNFLTQQDREDVINEVLNNA